MTFGSNRRLFPALALLLAIPAFPAAQSPAPAAAPAPAVTVFTIDPVHSGVRFEIDHLLVSTVAGRFTQFKGTISLNKANSAQSGVEVVIEAASISTDESKRDTHLKSADFFDVAKYPTITFKSTSVTDTGNGQLNVTGTFTMHGVSRTIVIPVSQRGPIAGMAPGSQVVGYKGTVSLKRSDYGMDKMIGLIGDKVDITLTVEANAAPVN
jgi:polyisoprenoid-binding protein YceI